MSKDFTKSLNESIWYDFDKDKNMYNSKMYKTGYYVLVAEHVDMRFFKSLKDPKMIVAMVVVVFFFLISLYVLCDHMKKRSQLVTV